MRWLGLRLGNTRGEDGGRGKGMVAKEVVKVKGEVPPLKCNASADC